MNLSLEPQFATCPKCQCTYDRNSGEIDNRCPKCGVIYDKYIQHHANIEHPEINQSSNFRLTTQAPLSTWEKFKLVLCLFPFFAIGAIFSMVDSQSLNLHRTLEQWLMVSILNAWLAYRIVNAIGSGALYTRSRYATKGNWYYRESHPYMFWQTIITWLLGIVVLLTGFVLLP